MPTKIETCLWLSQARRAGNRKVEYIAAKVLGFIVLEFQPLSVMEQTEFGNVGNFLEVSKIR